MQNGTQKANRLPGVFHESMGTQPSGIWLRACSNSANVTPGSGMRRDGATSVSTETVSGS